MTNKNTVLIVDDEPDIRELLEITLIRMGLNCVCAANTKEALELLRNNTYKLCLTDMNLGDGTGIEVIEFIQEHSPNTPVAMITAYGNTETAITAMKAGAFDYVAKPIDLPKLRALINSAIKIEESQQQEEAIRSFSSRMLGSSEAISTLRSKIMKLSRSLAPVFINGESGSGKELVARMIHQQGPRAAKPFIAVNCGAIPSELMESEFFGHEKGSFTGATESKEGLFRAAEGGTLFLDEVADLPKDMQVKLLRAIQEKAIRPVGANKEIDVDIRILSATHKNLVEEVANGSFRQDLFYRINVIELQVPSLRERPEDLVELCQHFLDKLSDRYGMPKPEISTAALNKLRSYHFPGNVRELENILERAFTLCENDCIDADDLLLKAANLESQASPSLDTALSAIEPEASATTVVNNADNPMGIDFNLAVGNFDDYMLSIEKQILQEALEKTRWNKTAAAELLGISFRTMRYKLKKLEID